MGTLETHRLRGRVPVEEERRQGLTPNVICFSTNRVVSVSGRAQALRYFPLFFCATSDGLRRPATKVDGIGLTRSRPGAPAGQLSTRLAENVDRQLSSFSKDYSSTYAEPKRLSLASSDRDPTMSVLPLIETAKPI